SQLGTFQRLQSRKSHRSLRSTTLPRAPFTISFIAGMGTQSCILSDDPIVRLLHLWTSHQPRTDHIDQLKSIVLKLGVRIGFLNNRRNDGLFALCNYYRTAEK